VAHPQLVLPRIISQQVAGAFANDVLSQYRQRTEIVQISYVPAPDAELLEHFTIIGNVSFGLRQQGRQPGPLIRQNLRAGRARPRFNLTQNLQAA